MEIRQAEISDLDDLSALFDEYRQFYEQESNINAARSFIEERLSRNDSVILMGLNAEKPVGFIQLYPSYSSIAMQRSFILNDLYVCPSARNKGVATALLEQSEALAFKAGAVRLTLATEITNAAAQAIYEKLGWQKNERFIYFNKSIEA